MSRWSKADERKKKAIDRLYAATTEGILHAAQAEVLEGVIHDLFSFSEAAQADIDSNPNLSYLKDD